MRQKSRRLIRRAWAAAAAALICVAAAGAQAQEVTLRLHQFLPLTSSIPRDAINPWIASVEAASNGRIKIEHYPSMQLGGKPPALYDQARDGVVDIVWTVLGYTPGRFPTTETFELPWLVTTGEATSRAFHRFAAANALSEFRGVKPLILHTHGPGVLHVRGDGVATLEDMRGKKIRGPSRMITRLLESFGATAVGMPVPAVPQALSKGVIDGVAIPWQVTISLKTNDLVGSHTEFSGGRGLYTIGFTLGMNQARYDSLPGDIKAVIDAHSGPEWAGRFGAAMDADDTVGRQLALEAGNTVRVLDEAESARWRDASQTVMRDWLAEMAANGRDGAALLDEARRLIDEETARN